MHPKFLGLYAIDNIHWSTRTTKYAVEEILKRCGKYLLKIDVTFFRFRFTCLFSLIGEYCPSIESIKTPIIESTGIKNILVGCKNLSELYVLGGLLIAEAFF